jgi:hypothetical protein
MDVDWNTLVNEAVMQMIKIFVPVLVVLVCKWLVEIWKKLSEKNPELAKLLAYAAQMGYAAAEDYFRNISSAEGDDKMTYAIFRAKEYLSNLGAKVPDEDVIKDAITEYGVTHYKFSWAKPTHPLTDLLMIEEEDDEPGASDHLCVGDHRDDHNCDCDKSSDGSAGSAQVNAEDKDRE